jgi:hypothetical protein
MSRLNSQWSQGLRQRYCLHLLILALLPFVGAIPGSAEGRSNEEGRRGEIQASASARLRPASQPYPNSVQSVVDEGRRDCLAQGGGRFSEAGNLVRAGDLTGDGRRDYVVDFREAQCSGRETVFSGTGGWDLAIFVARQSGEPVRVFQGRVLDYDLDNKSGRPRMTFTLHGSYCGRVGSDQCIKRRRVNQRPFAFQN